jgi:pre-mRNA-processing factor SLU7
VLPRLQPANEKTFFGDNFVRNSGDYTAWQALNLHSMQAFDKGTEVHVQALPSLAEVMYQQYKSKKESMTSKSKEEVLAKYGNTGEGGGEKVEAVVAGAALVPCRVVAVVEKLELCVGQYSLNLDCTNVKCDW